MKIDFEFILKSIAVPVFVALVTTLLAQLLGDSVDRKQQARLDRVIAFAAQQEVLVDIASGFMRAAQTNDDMGNVKGIINVSVSKQIEAGKALKEMFSGPSGTLVDSYTVSLERFRDALESYDSAADYGRWRKAFGDVVDTRDALSRSLIADVGLKP
jgi:hypothetical protein